jgi:SAM-dependent methyltransferase
VYERARPSYPEAAVDWIVEALELAPGAHVVDVGTGTGKFARQLAARGVRITGVEPIAEMRALFEQTVPGAHAVHGTAESMPLDDEVADGITAAQAFHWFDRERAPRELHRVLRPGAGVALIWNMRDETTPLQQAYAELLRPYKGADYPERGRQAQPLADSPLFGDVEEREFTHSQRLDEDGLVARTESVSFVAQLPDDERAALLERIRALAPPETFEFPYVTKVFTARGR